MKREFVDFEEIVGKLRVDIDKEITALFNAENNKMKSIDCDGSYLQINTAYSLKSVKEIWFDDEFQCTTILTYDIPSEEHDFMDLETDDMVAIYEYVYNAFNPTE